MRRSVWPLLEEVFYDVRGNESCMVFNLSVIVFLIFVSATNSAMKISQAKKHPLTRAEALPTAKRKKTGNYWVTANECCIRAVIILSIF